MTEWTHTYYHAMLDRQIRARIVGEHKRGIWVQLEDLDGMRKLTHKQAEQVLRRVREGAE